MRERVKRGESEKRGKEKGSEEIKDAGGVDGEGRR